MGHFYVRKCFLVRFSERVNSYKIFLYYDIRYQSSC